MIVLALTNETLTAIGGMGAFAAALVLAAIAVYQAKQSRDQTFAMERQVDVIRNTAQAELQVSNELQNERAEATAWLTYANRLTWQRYYHFVAWMVLWGYALRPGPRFNEPRNPEARDVDRVHALVLALIFASGVVRLSHKQRLVSRPIVAEAAGTDSVWHSIANEIEPTLRLHSKRRAARRKREVVD